MSSAIPELQPALVVTDLSVTFGATRALQDAALRVERGTIHALLGGNGSGKSTLVKAVAGIVRADPAAGTIDVLGRRHAAAGMTPQLALDEGLRFVHQDLGMFPTMTIAENFALYARYPTSRAGQIRWPLLRRQVGELLARFEIDASPDTKIARLSPVVRTMLAVARALQGDDDRTDRILVLDEPTATLPAAESEFLLQALRRRAALGQTVIFVGHRLQEVLSLVDDITVLRDGRTVATLAAAEATERIIVEHIAGRTVDHRFPDVGTAPTGDGDAVVAVEHLEAGPVRDVSLEVRKGEVVGIAGLQGSGRSALLRALFGDLPVTSGGISVDGVAGPFRNIGSAIGAGVAYVPEDRVNDSTFVDLSISDNLSAAVVPSYFRRGWLAERSQRHDSRRLVGEYAVRAASVEHPLGALSGGNQQKVVMARWLRRRPKLLLLDEPTQGVDVVARAEIYRLLQRGTETGTAVIVVSSDFDELASVCNRVLVMVDGRTTREIHGAELTADRLHHLVHTSQESRHEQDLVR